jgi:hypothetical protein
MESAVRHVAKTLGLPEPVLQDFLSVVRSLQTWGDTDIADDPPSGASKLTQTAAGGLVKNNSDL